MIVYAGPFVVQGNSYRRIFLLGLLPMHVLEASVTHRDPSGLNAIKSKSKVKSNNFIMRLKVEQRVGLLSLLHLGIFAIHTRYFLI